MLRLDERDERILSLLQEDAWLTYAQLSRLVNLSASAVQRRVERMTAAGIILGAKAQIERADVAPQLIVFLLAGLADESTSALKLFRATVVSSSPVVEAYYVAGESDVLLKLRLPDMAAYDRFVEEHINSSALVQRFKTLTVLRALAP